MLTKSEVKYIQSLSQKKFRDQEGIYMAEGPKMVEEALSEGNLIIKRIFATENWATAHKDVGSVTTVAAHELLKISQLKTPNQVLAILEKPIPSDAVFDKSGLSLVLDGIQDPGNLGTIIRTADWFGVKQVVCSPDCADAFASKVVQSTMGSIFRIHIFYRELEEWIQENPDLTFYGAALQGKPLQQIRGVASGAVVIGNESKGIRDAVMQHIHEKITIDKKGKAESLNAAVATGIILAHLTTQ